MSRQPSEEPNLARFNSDPNLANLEEAKEIKKNHMPVPPSPVSPKIKMSGRRLH